MPRSWMVVLLAALVVGALGAGAAGAGAQTGCGGLLQPACTTTTSTTPPPTTPPTTPPPTTPPPTTPAPTTPPPPITSGQYKRVERYLAANAGRSQGEYVAACGALVRSGDFISRPLGMICSADLRAVTASTRFQKCKAFKTCSRAVSSLHANLSNELDALREANRTYGAVSVTACRSALSSPAHDIRVFQSLVNAYGGLDDAYSHNSVKRYKAAVKRLKAVDFSHNRKPAAQLSQFRAGCAS